MRWLPDFLDKYRDDGNRIVANIVADVVMAQAEWSDSDERNQAMMRLENRRIRSGSDQTVRLRRVRRRVINFTRVPRTRFREK